MNGRILAVGFDTPWTEPPTGAPLRKVAMLRALSRLGPVDYACFQSTRGEESRGNPFGDLYRVALPTVRPATRLRRARWRVAALVRPGRSIPIEVARLTRAGMRAQFRPLLERGYDLVWFSELRVAGIMPDIGPPTIVDLYDLEEERFEQQLAMARTAPKRSRSFLRKHRLRLLRAQVRAWQNISREVTTWSTVSFVTKEKDRQALGLPGVVVVPNGCDVPPLRRPRGIARRPTILFHGLMTYGPNRDGAEYLAREIVPEMRQVLGPEFDARIVGRTPRSIVDLGLLPNVIVTGYVPDITAELRAADVVVVPLRMGSGTRIKILEAFAQQVPVVSTSIGCDGLDVLPEEHLLVAETPGDFARACSRLLSDANLRSRLIANAHELVSRKYEWQVIEAQVATLVSNLIRGNDP